MKRFWVLVLVLVGLYGCATNTRAARGLNSVCPPRFIVPNSELVVGLDLQALTRINGPHEYVVRAMSWRGRVWGNYVYIFPLTGVERVVGIMPLGSSERDADDLEWAVDLYMAGRMDSESETIVNLIVSSDDESKLQEVSDECWSAALLDSIRVIGFSELRSQAVARSIVPHAGQGASISRHPQSEARPRFSFDSPDFWILVLKVLL